MRPKRFAGPVNVESTIEILLSFEVFRERAPKIAITPLAVSFEGLRFRFTFSNETSFFSDAVPYRTP